MKNNLDLPILKLKIHLHCYSALASKWEFEQMGIWPQNSLQVIREQMGIRANGNVPRKIMQND